MAGITRFENLDAWRLADELKQRVYALVDTTTAKRDFRFRDQIRESAASASSAIAEGFGRYHHPEFSFMVRVARASLMETQNHLRDGVHRQHWSEASARPLAQLADRAIGATTNLINYLDSTDDSGQPRRKSKR
jgi:four helix bundle protein